MNGAIDAASSSEPIGLSRGVPVEAGARHADAAELHVTLGQAATAAMPRRQVSGPRHRGRRRARCAAGRRCGSGRSGGPARPARSRPAPVAGGSRARRRRRAPCAPARARRPGTPRSPAGPRGVRGRVLDLRMRVPRHAWRMPRKRFGLAACSASSTGSTRSPSFRLAWPTMAAAARAGPVEPACAGRRQPLHELDLAHRPHLLGPVRAVHRPRLDEHRRAHVVAAADVARRARGAGSADRGCARCESPRSDGAGRRSGSSGSSTGSCVSASQSFPPNGTMAPPWS